VTSLGQNDGVILCARTLVGLLLVISGISKLIDLASFVKVVQSFRLLPISLTSAVAHAIPWVECLTGGLLLAAVLLPRSAARSSAMSAVGLFLVFGGAVAINLMKGRRDISCGCFGSHVGGSLSWFLATRNCALATVAWLAYGQCSVYANAPASGWHVGWAPALVGLSILLGWQLVTSLVRLESQSKLATKKGHL
jgi:uncharacterized membrane protein YphA (DoxX/SURF4 family)